MRKPMDGTRSFVFFLSEEEEEKTIGKLNQKIEAYNRRAERTSRSYHLSEENMDLRPQRIRPVRDPDTLELWRRMRGYVLSRLSGSVYYLPFCNNITNRESHVSFEMKYFMSRATYYKYVGKGYEVVKEYMMFHHLMEL